MYVSPPCTAQWSRRNRLLSFKDTLAPRRNSILKALCLPARAAAISGVKPSSHLVSISRPSDNSLLIMDVFPPAAALCSRLNPLLSFKDALAPFCINIWKATSLPLSAACISGVTPSLSFEPTSNPWDSNEATISIFPLFATAWSSPTSWTLYSTLESLSSILAGTGFLGMNESLWSRKIILKYEC